MRFFKVLLAFAALAMAMPQPEASKDDLNMFEAKSVEESKDIKRDDTPVLDARIDAHEQEGRSVNLSPQNNRRDGLLPRQCTGTCTCARGLSGLYCGYCNNPDRVTSCRSGSCFDNVYQCNSSGGCCSYGRRTSCANKAGPCNG